MQGLQESLASALVSVEPQIRVVISVCRRAVSCPFMLLVKDLHDRVELVQCFELAFSNINTFCRTTMAKGNTDHRIVYVGRVSCCSGRMLDWCLRRVQLFFDQIIRVRGLARPGSMAETEPPQSETFRELMYKLGIKHEYCTCHYQ